MLDFECVLNTGMNPKCLLMTLQIETCSRSAPSLYSEVYQLPDGTGKLYWVFELKSSRLLQFIHDYSNKKKLPQNMGLEEIFKQQHFIEEYQKINPAQMVCIPKEKMPVIYKIVNEGLPKDVQYPSGLDGHEYYLKTYEVDESLYLEKLVEGVKTGKQLPFRYYSAWQNVQKDSVRKALERCIDISVENLPNLEGRSLVLVDNSGSAVGTRVSALSNVSVSVCGNLMGVLTGLISDGGKIGVFGDEIKYVPITRDGKGTVLETLNMVNDIGEHVGYSTENGIWLALDDAIRSGEKFDRIFIYSDMQAGHGGLYGLNKETYPVFEQGRHGGYRYIDVPMLVAEYRKKVNPACKLYSIQIGGYSDNIFPEFYPDTCIMGGWSTELFRFVGMFEQDPMSIEELFRKTLEVPKR